MHFIPSELSFQGILFVPMLPVVVLGLILTLVVTRYLNKKRLSRHFWYPPLAFLALWVFFSSVIGLFILPT